MARARLYANNAERQAAYRARKGVTVTACLPSDVADALASYLDRQRIDGLALTRDQVLERLIRTTIMRKR